MPAELISAIRTWKSVRSYWMKGTVQCGRFTVISAKALMLPSTEDFLQSVGDWRSEQSNQVGGGMADMKKAESGPKWAGKRLGGEVVSFIM